MKKILTLSIISAGLLMSATPIHDIMDSKLKGKSFGGTLDDYEAASDGLGIIPLEHHTGLTAVNNELKAQKILTGLIKKETDLSKISNVKDSLINGLLGS